MGFTILDDLVTFSIIFMVIVTPYTICLRTSDSILGRHHQCVGNILRRNSFQIFTLTRLLPSCPSFAAGCTDGPGALNFKQGITEPLSFWETVTTILVPLVCTELPDEEFANCQSPKPVLLPTGCEYKYSLINIDI